MNMPTPDVESVRHLEASDTPIGLLGREDSGVFFGFDLRAYRTAISAVPRYAVHAEDSSNPIDVLRILDLHTRGQRYMIAAYVPTRFVAHVVSKLAVENVDAIYLKAEKNDLRVWTLIGERDRELWKAPSEFCLTIHHPIFAECKVLLVDDMEKEWIRHPLMNFLAATGRTNSYFFNPTGREDRTVLIDMLDQAFDIPAWVHSWLP